MKLITLYLQLDIIIIYTHRYTYMYVGIYRESSQSRDTIAIPLCYQRKRSQTMH